MHRSVTLPLEATLRESHQRPRKTLRLLVQRTRPYGRRRPCSTSKQPKGSGSGQSTSPQVRRPTYVNCAREVLSCSMRLSTKSGQYRDSSKHYTGSNGAMLFGESFLVETSPPVITSCSPIPKERCHYIRRGLRMTRVWW